MRRLRCPRSLRAAITLQALLSVAVVTATQTSAGQTSAGQTKGGQTSGGQTGEGQTGEGQTGAAAAGALTKNGNASKGTADSDSTDEHTEKALGVAGKLPTDGAAAPGKVQGRRTIGLALGGGGALAMSEIGVLQWFDEHHIPVDEVAGASMGCMVGALYSTGHSVAEMKTIMDDSVFSSVFSFQIPYQHQSFRRREAGRELPNALEVGLKRGVSFRNAVLTDHGLNDFLGRQFFRYDDRTDFNTLPIPLRCVASDLTDAKVVTFARGSLPDAVRASVSLPAVYPPFVLNGHLLVDGGVLDNLPTGTVKSMRADVILAVSLPLSPLENGDLGSLLGVLQRSFSVAIENAEEQQRKLAQVVVKPDLKGFTQTDYLKTPDLAQRGYAAAEAMRADLLPYAISDAEWQRYLAKRVSKLRGPAGTVLRIRVKAPTPQVTRELQRKFDPLMNRPVDFTALDTTMDELRADGRYQADYTVGYEAKGENRPVILVTVTDRKNGPPFLDVGANVRAQAGGITQATAEAFVIHQDFGGYGSELQGRLRLGYVTELGGEYVRRVKDTGANGGYFVAPDFDFLRHPFNIFAGQHRVAERELQTVGGGVDLGWGDSHNQEWRAGYQAANVRWTRNVGSDGAPDLFGSMQRPHLSYVYDVQDGALVPRYGLRLQVDAGYLLHSVASRDAPQISTRASFARARGKNDFILGAEGGTMLNRNVAEPFRFTLGGPLRLSSFAIDALRGTDYFLVEPAYLRQIAHLPAPLGQNIYLGLGYEAGQMRAPDRPTVTRQDVYFGLIAETPLGMITIAPAFGDGGYRKFNFTLGKVF